VDGAACAVGRIGPDGPWIGFAPSIDDGYALVVGGLTGTARRAAADADDLVALASVYFEETLDPAPEELAATLADIGSLVRHVAEHETDSERRRVIGEAVDAVDDGLAADVTIARLGRALGEGVDATARIRGRVDQMLISG
jgi:hypothetical protein